MEPQGRLNQVMGKDLNCSLLSWTAPSGALTLVWFCRRYIALAPPVELCGVLSCHTIGVSWGRSFHIEWKRAISMEEALG